MTEDDPSRRAEEEPISPGGSGARRGTVHVIDDDEPVRRAVAMLLRSAGVPVATHPSGLAFLDALTVLGEEGAGCVLTDVRMPGLDGVELLRRLGERGFRRPVVVITAHGDVPTAVRAMKAGAADFIDKPFDDKALLASVEAALTAPESPPPVAAGAADPAAAEAAARIAALSPREREVLDRMMAGMSNKAIANELGLSPRTVEVHRARLMARLGVGSVAEAVRLAVRAELGRRDASDGS
jgi:two-component system, LuxR family, response regulator FixJ